MKKSFRKVVIASAVILSAMAFQPHEVKAFDFGGGFSSSNFGSSFSASDYAPISSNSSSSSSLSNISTSDYRPISTPSVSESASNISSSDYRPISTPSVNESASNVSSSDYRPISTPSVSESVSSVSSSDYRPISTPSVSESASSVSSSDYQPISTPSVSESVSNVSSSDYRPISTPSVSEDASNIKPSDYKPISDSSVSASDSLADSVDYKPIAGKDDTVTTDSLAKKGKDDALKMADSKVDQSATDALGAVDFTEKALESANAGTQKASTGSSRYNLAVSPEVETALDSLSEEHRNQFIKALKDYGYGLNNSETSATTTPEYTLSSTSSSNKGKLDFTPYGQSTLTDSQGQPTSAYQDLLDLANSKESQPLFNQSASNDYQIKKGDSLAKIGNLHYPDDKEKAAAASMLALQDLHGQNKLNINNKQNRINLTPGDKVNVDLSNYTSEEISALAKGFNKIQSAENKIDTFRQAQEEAKALARAQERQNRASQARQARIEARNLVQDQAKQNHTQLTQQATQKSQASNYSSPWSSTMQQILSLGRTKKTDFAYAKDGKQVATTNRYRNASIHDAYAAVKNQAIPKVSSVPELVNEVKPGAVSKFFSEKIALDSSGLNKELAQAKISPNDHSFDAYTRRAAISGKAIIAAAKEQANDTVGGIATIADFGVDIARAKIDDWGWSKLSNEDRKEINNRLNALGQGLSDKWNAAKGYYKNNSSSEMWSDALELAGRFNPVVLAKKAKQNFMAGDGLAQKEQAKTVLEFVPVSKASLAGKIAKNGVGSAAHAIASKTGKVLNTAESFGKNLFDATKSKVDNFGEKWFPQPSMVTPEGLVLDVPKPSHSKSAPAYLSKKTDSNLGLTNNKDGVGGKNSLNNTIDQEVGQQLAKHSNEVAKSLEETAETAKKPFKEVEYGEQFTKGVNGRKELLPNVQYVAENGYRYTTDEFGRISRVEVDDLVLKKGKRNAHSQRVAGREYRITEAELKAGLDDGGHLIGTQFNGSGDLDNLVAMNREINRSGGTWYNMEEEWASALKEVPPRKVTVDIQPVYSGKSLRPDSFKVIYEIEGKMPEVKTILNQIGG